MRGMKKWQPFKSLNGQYRVLEEHRREKTLVEKPELSYDQVEEINETITSLQRGDNVFVTYYCDGEIKKNCFLFLKCDPLVHQLYFQETKISFHALLGIEKI